MHIGLVGGIGPAATDYYYRRLISGSPGGGVNLELTIVHASSATLLPNLQRGDKAAQVDIFLRLANRLRDAGAQAVAITAIAGHFCIEEFKAVSPIPVVDLLQEVRMAVAGMGVSRVGILGTRAVMETGFYGAIDTAEVLAPSGTELDDVHEAYVATAAAGSVTEAQRELFFAAGRRLVAEQGAQAIMLGGTDLVLAFDGRDCGFDVIDCAGIHIAALAKMAAA